MSKKYTFDDLLSIMEKLRAEDGCPWDREQTHESIKRSIMEEGYELIEAIDTGDGAKMADESGDLLLQVVFHAQIGKELGEYDMSDVTDAICKKLIHRHPHIFGGEDIKTADGVLDMWDAIKRNDRDQKTVAEELRGISKYLPSLTRAEKIQGKASKTGYLFNDTNIADSVFNKLKMIDENTDKAAAEKYLGQILFSIVTAAKKAGVDAEVALNREISNFISEYEKYESESK
ncbi:MAG: nucleoside triphosphate pyrophosphohydrolase [Clostridia bacterium]|nr:nucleoside triphosphate pyrophosphohydrolase [Clostridia bacterium]